MISTYTEVARHPLKLIFRRNRPLPSSNNPHFQNEARCTIFLVKMSFICIRMKNDCHIKGWAPTLVLKQRPGVTQKWPIGRALSLQLGIRHSWRFFFLFFFQIKRQCEGSGSSILLFTIIFREEDMRNSWTHFWHKLYGNCYTFNKGINDVGEITEVMNSSQAGLGNWLKFLQQTFLF